MNYLLYTCICMPLLIHYLIRIHHCSPFLVTRKWLRNTIIMKRSQPMRILLRLCFPLPKNGFMSYIIRKMTRYHPVLESS